MTNNLNSEIEKRILLITELCVLGLNQTQDLWVSCHDHQLLRQYMPFDISFINNDKLKAVFSSKI